MLEALVSEGLRCHFDATVRIGCFQSCQQQRRRIGILPIYSSGGALELTRAPSPDHCNIVAQGQRMREAMLKPQLKLVDSCIRTTVRDTLYWRLHTSMGMRTYRVLQCPSQYVKAVCSRV